MPEYQKLRLQHECLLHQKNNLINTNEQKRFALAELMRKYNVQESKDKEDGTEDLETEQLKAKYQLRRE